VDYSFGCTPSPTPPSFATTLPMTLILQKSLPHAPWMDPRTARLPGVQPVAGDDWLRVDDAFAGQMGERDRLTLGHAPLVHALLPEAEAAAGELYARVLAYVRGTPGYAVTASRVTRPDGVVVGLDAGQPLLTLGRLVQEDLCILQDDGTEHVLTGATLCFPASWTLREKIGRPMGAIHAPVHDYDARIATSVQRMMRAIQPGQMLWRANALVYDDATLHQPRVEGARRPRPVEGLYLRSERQSFVRLPVTGAVVFAIHTYVVRVCDLSAEAQAGMAAAGLGQTD
jgi:dimethylamine monooxygenase subunit A